MPSISLPFLIVVALLVFAPSIHAWESDVHFGLTKWLAIQAGYTPQQAQWIADGNQGMDGSDATDAVQLTLMAACIGTDPTKSRRVHDYHFAGDKTTPNDPADRYVKPGSVLIGGAQRPVPKITDYTDKARFNELGEYLHTFQDSWSHQGEPDFPQPPCNPKLAWGHALARGGWSCHFADLTWPWRNTDALQMAKATYEVLLAQKPGSAKPWTQIEPEVSDFAERRSKWDKDEWFARQDHFADRSFLQLISLPDCVLESPQQCRGPYPFQKLLDTWSDIVARHRNAQPPAIPASIPREFVDLFRDFASGLVQQRQNLRGSLIEAGLAAVTLRRALRIKEACPVVEEKVTRVMLGPGFSKGWGARQPKEMCELIAETATLGKDAISCDDATKRLEDYPRNVLPVGPDNQEMTRIAQAQDLPPFVTTAAFDPSSESYIAFVRFIHLPRDILMLTARRVNDAAKIVGAVWVPDQ